MIRVSKEISNKTEELKLHLLNIIEPCLNRDAINGYLNVLYKYFVNKGENENFSFFDFQDVFQLPMFIGKTIFNSFDTEKNMFLSREQFVDNVNCLFSGSLDQKIILASRIFDLDSDDIINIEDVQLIFYHFHFNMTKTNLCLMDEIITNFFENNTKLTVLTFRHITQTANSDILLLLVLFLSKYCPFSEEKIKYYLSLQEIEEKTNTFQKGKLKSSQMCCMNTGYLQLFPPSEHLLNYIIEHFNLFFDSDQYSELSCLETFENDFKNVISLIEDSPSLSELPKSNSNLRKKQSKDSLQSTDNLGFKLNNFFVSRSSKQMLPHLYPVTINKKTPTISNFALSTFCSSNNVLTAQNINIEINVFHISRGRLKKIKLVLIEDSIFFFKKNIHFVLTKIIPIKSISVKENKEVMVNNRTYYPFQIVPTLLNNKKKILLLGVTQKEVREFLSCIDYENPKVPIENDYDIGDEIGKGKFGIVLKCKNKTTQELCAVKILDKSLIVDDHTLEMVKWEIDIFHFFLNASHPGIIQSKNYYETSSHIFLVFELAEGGDLFSYINNRKSPITDLTLLSLLRQVVDSLSYLHKFGIVHRDIKPQNILLKEVTNEQIQFKIIDFGLSKVIGKYESTMETHGSLMFASPEVLLNEPYSQKVDIWSLGVTIYYLVYGKFPFFEKDWDSREIADLIIKCTYKFSVSLISSNGHLIDKDIQDIVKGCLKKEKWRYTIEQVEKEMKKIIL